MQNMPISFITAPFVTAHVSLQLSIIKHLNKYGDYQTE